MHYRRISREAWYGLVGLGLLLTVVSAAAGFWYGQQTAGAGAPSARTIATVQAIVRQQRAEIREAKKESIANLDAFGSRLGEMQSELLRLNALGERLVEMAGLSREEFDFDDPPGAGGPEQLAARDLGVGELAGEMSRLLRELQDRESKLDLLEQLIMERRIEDQTMPEGSPVRSGYITSKFGYRADPISGRRAFHSGVDFAGKRGADVFAVADGLVIFSGERTGYGRIVEIRHGNGLVTRYAHNEKLLVKDGDIVKKGQPVATLGSSGRTTGPHVHFEVLEDGEAVDPMKYVGLEKTRAKG